MKSSMKTRARGGPAVGGSGSSLEAWLKAELLRACGRHFAAGQRYLLPLLEKIGQQAGRAPRMSRLAAMFRFLSTGEMRTRPPATLTLAVDPALRREESGVLDAHRSLLLRGTEQEPTRFVVLAGQVEMDDRTLPLRQTIELQPMDTCVVRAGSRLLFPRAALNQLLVAALLSGFAILPRVASGRRPRSITAPLSVVAGKTTGTSG